MVEFMRRVALVPQELSLDERNLLSVAYKNSVGARRQAWRAIHTYMQKMASDHAMAEIAAYRRRVEDELNEKCNDIIKILDSDLVEKAVSSEAKVFYLKMRGDYYRYLAEFTDGIQRDQYAGAAHESYQTANELAVPLPPTHPIRLGLALNFSLAKEAFENAMGDLDSLDAEQYKDSAAIMQLLRDNLALWQNDLPGDGKAEQDGTQQIVLPGQGSSMNGEGVPSARKSEVTFLEDGLKHAHQMNRLLNVNLTDRDQICEMAVEIIKELSEVPEIPEEIRKGLKALQDGTMFL
eukprot:g3027.t1